VDTSKYEDTSLGLTMTWGQLGPKLLEIVSVVFKIIHQMENNVLVLEYRKKPSSYSRG